MANPGQDAERREPSLMEVRYEFTPVLPGILAHLNASLMVTTYQAGKLLVLGVHNGQLQISFSGFDRPMGLAVDQNRMAIGSQHQIHYYAANRDVAPVVVSEGLHDVCYVARSSKCTGRLHGHDLAWGTEGLWLVNTLFSCLCTLHRDFNFVPRWKPPFISEIIDEDRCHLNGLALEHGQPRYVTALSETDTAAGWRPDKATSGIMIDVVTDEVMARGLCMPHSPRMHNGRLWVLDSGRGSLCTVDPTNGTLTTVAQFPGYTRGLSFCGQFAFVGLSRIRETSVFGGVPIAERRDELKCGIGVVDLLSGRPVAVFQFLSGVTEIYAVEIVPGARSPFVAGASEGGAEHDVWIVPPLGMLPPADARLPWFAGGSFAADDLHSERSGVPTTVEEWLKNHPDDSAAWITLGNVCQEQSREAEAIKCYQRAVAANPESVPARQNLGHLLYNQGFPEKAYEVLNELPKASPAPLNRLLAASVLPIIYSSVEDVEIWRKLQSDALRSMVDDGCVIDATQTLVPTTFFWPYQGFNDVEIMKLRAQIIRGDNNTAKTRNTSGTSTTDRVRVGFLSAYLRQHTIGRLNIGRIERLDRSKFDVTVICAFDGIDDYTDRLERTADRFLRLPRDLQSAIEAMRTLDLDILLFTDVGMDSLCSTLAYSRFAPIQCATWGHPETTGSPAIDYFLSSELLETEHADQHYSETLLRMPLTGTWYERPHVHSTSQTRRQHGLPAESHLYVCPQSLFKLHPDFDSVLAEILKLDHQGLLVLIRGRVPEWTRRLEERWRRMNVDHLSRAVFLPALSHSEYLQLLKEADVVLDPPHFGGGNSSYEALAMNRPIVTLPGEYLRGRITQALYRKMDLMDFVVKSPDEYVALSVRLGSDESFRVQSRQRIEEKVGVLFEDPDEVACFEDAIIGMVRSGPSG